MRSFNGQEIIVRDICAKFIACVKKFMGIMDIAVSFDPGHAALPWAAVRFVLLVGANSSPSDEEKGQDKTAYTEFLAMHEQHRGL